MKHKQIILMAIISMCILVASGIIACGGQSAAAPTNAPTTVAPTLAQPTVAPTIAKPTTVPTIAETTVAPTVAKSEDAKLLNATFARKLAENQAPVEPTDEFAPTDTVNLSLEFDGRPKTGIVKTRFLLQDQLIAEAQVDFAEANSGVLFSVGEVTYAGFFLTPENPWPPSDKYHADVSLNDKSLGTYKFRMVGTTDSTPTSAPAATTTTPANEAFSFGQFKLYTHPKGYFSVMLPSTWQMQDRSSTDEGILVGVQEPGQRGLVTVQLVDADRPTDGEALTQAVSSYAERYYGSQDGYKLLKAAAQDETSAAAGYTFIVDINGTPTDMAAVTSVVRQDDRVGFLTVIVPLSETKSKEVTEAIGTIGGSFEMNSKLPLHK